MHAKTDLIFVSIAAYRDAQLVPTVEDCLRKADMPERVRFGVCWQHGEEETLPPSWGEERFRILGVPWFKSRGACWARAEVMTLWQGEPWFLQVDSHCRFRPGWDTFLIEQAASLAPAKVVLSTYASPFVPEADHILEQATLQIGFAGFTAEGIPHMKPLAMPRSGRARRARFLSAGFLFAPGRFVREVPYDPGLYFLGEEIAMTVRAFTAGYDLFHPGEPVVWHDYERRSAVKHWDDHADRKRVGADWAARDRGSKERVRRLLAGEPLEAFPLGTERTLADYEAYAGISFRARKVQDYTLRAEEPPNPVADPNWAETIYPWMVRVALPTAELCDEARTDVAMWYLGVHDALGHEIFRRDLTAAEVEALPWSEPTMILICDLEAGSPPASWTLWPLSQSRGWLPKVQGSLAGGDYAIVLEEGTAEGSA